MIARWIEGRTKAQRGVAAFAALCAALTLMVAAPAAAQDDACTQKLSVLAENQAIPLKVVLNRLDDAQRSAALKWAECAAGDHMGLATVYEQAVRALDAKNVQDNAHTFYLSPSQKVTVSDPEGAFARSEVTPVINTVPAARQHAMVVLGPPAGAGTWSSVLAELNAETHGLDAALALEKAGLLGDAPAANANQLGTTLLITAAYIAQAEKDHAVAFKSLASSPESVDALGSLWKRAQDALVRSRGGKLGKDVNAIFKAIEAHTPAVGRLFKQAGIKAPEFASVAAPVAQKPVEGDNKPAEQPVQAPKAEEKPAEQPAEVKEQPAAANNAAADAKPEGEGKPAEQPKAEEKPAVANNKPVEEPKAEEKPAEKPAEVKEQPAAADNKPVEQPKAEEKPAEQPAKKDEPVQKAGDMGQNPDDAKKPEAPKAQEPPKAAEGKDAGAAGATETAEEGLTTSNKVRLGFGIFLLLLPWILLGVMAGAKRRRPEFYHRLANRTLAISTLLLVLEALGVSVSLNFVAVNSFWAVDSVFLMFPIYMMVVVMLMLGKIDSEGELASRQLINKWGKWVIVSILAVIGVAVGLALTILAPWAAMVFLSAGLIIAAIASVFMIKLWRTGDAPGATTVQKAAEDRQITDGDDAAEASAPTEGPKDPAPKAPEAKAPEAKAPSKPAPAAEPDLVDLDEPAPAEQPAEDDNPAAGMSDDDLIKAFSGLSGGSDKSSERKPLSDDDRSELDRLLDEQ